MQFAIDMTISNFVTDIHAHARRPSPVGGMQWILANPSHAHVYPDIPIAAPTLSGPQLGDHALSTMIHWCLQVSGM